MIKMGTVEVKFTYLRHIDSGLQHIPVDQKLINHNFVDVMLILVVKSFSNHYTFTL